MNYKIIIQITDEKRYRGLIEKAGKIVFRTFFCETQEEAYKAIIKELLESYTA